MKKEEIKVAVDQFEDLLDEDEFVEDVIEDDCCNDEDEYCEKDPRIQNLLNEMEEDSYEDCCDDEEDRDRIADEFNSYDDDEEEVDYKLTKKEYDELQDLKNQSLSLSDQLTQAFNE